MSYLARSLDERLDPRHVLATAQSVVSVASVYNSPRSDDTEENGAGRVSVARYARGDDYHDVLRATPA